MKSCIDSPQMILLSSASMIVKGLCVKTWTRWDPEICLRMTTSRKALMDVRSVTLIQTLVTHAKFPLIPWTHCVRCLDTRDTSIWASGSCSGQEDDRSRDAALTIHVNVAAKDNYRLRQWNRTQKDHLILVWVSFVTCRNVVSRFISYWIVLRTSRYMTRTNAHTHHVKKWINVTSTHANTRTSDQSINHVNENSSAPKKRNTKNAQPN